MGLTYKLNKPTIEMALYKQKYCPFELKGTEKVRQN